MELVLLLQVLVLGLHIGLPHGAKMDACMMVLLSEEFHSACSTLGRNHIRPCLVQSDKDVIALKIAKVVHRRLSVPRNKICAARTGTRQSDCISVHLTCSTQQNWQWSEWAGTSPNIARKFAVTEGDTNILCPYEERYFTPEVFFDCLDALNYGTLTSGVYKISPDGITELQVYCEQELDGGGWTVFQRRQNGEVDFFKTWAEYKAGFGNLTGEFWLGNDYIYLLTKNHDSQLKFHLGFPEDDEWATADYSEFWIGDEMENYKAHVGPFTGGVAGNSFTYHHEARFSTKDRGITGCAAGAHGAWWYKRCLNSNLNGKYGSTEYAKGLSWLRWKGFYTSIPYTSIMVRRKED